MVNLFPRFIYGLGLYWQDSGEVMESEWCQALIFYLGLMLPIIHNGYICYTTQQVVRRQCSAVMGAIILLKNGSTHRNGLEWQKKLYPNIIWKGISIFFHIFLILCNWPLQERSTVPPWATVSCCSLSLCLFLLFSHSLHLYLLHSSQGVHRARVWPLVRGQDVNYCFPVETFIKRLDLINPVGLWLMSCHIHYPLLCL